MQTLGRVGEQIAMLMHGAALHRHAVPHGGDRLVKPGGAVDNEEVGPPQAAPGETWRTARSSLRVHAGRTILTSFSLDRTPKISKGKYEFEGEVSMATKHTRSRFIVDLGDVEIPEPALKRLNDKIQMAVLDELAGIDLTGDIGVRFPREWLGLWVRLVRPNDLVSKEFDQLEQKMGDIMQR